MIIPAPDEWAQEQLKKYITAIRGIGERIARIYCPDISEEEKEEKTA